MSRINTRDVILDTSRELFNSQGVDYVSINKLADHLSISTGNLTYHFKRKRDIIATHLEMLESGIVDILEDFPLEGNAREFIEAYARLFEITWHYRFLFNNAAHLIQNKLLDTEEYERLINHIQGVVIARIEHLTQAGLMSEVAPPFSAKTLSDSMWWQWLGWLEVNQIRKPADQLAFPKLLASGIKHSIFITHHYMKKRYLNQLLAALEEFETRA
jgi:AcrR family transcriptional regulator